MSYLLVVEIAVRPASGDIDVVLSIPGREGTVTRTWRGRGSGQRVTVPQLQDLSSWVSLSVENWLLGSTGAQEVLGPL